MIFWSSRKTDGCTDHCINDGLCAVKLYSVIKLLYSKKIDLLDKDYLLSMGSFMVPVYLHIGSSETSLLEAERYLTDVIWVDGNWWYYAGNNKIGIRNLCTHSRVPCTVDFPFHLNVIRADFVVSCPIHALINGREGETDDHELVSLLLCLWMCCW